VARRPILTTIDGFPLEAAILSTGVERASVLGVAPRRREVKLIAILPDEEIEMFFVSYELERSKRLLDLGRRDARRVLDDLGPGPG
jgi:hypothetical protein